MNESVTVPTTIMQLRDGSCRWPIAEAFYCGAPAHGRQPYCATHAKLAYEPAPERARRDGRLGTRGARENQVIDQPSEGPHSDRRAQGRTSFAGCPAAFSPQIHRRLRPPGKIKNWPLESGQSARGGGH